MNEPHKLECMSSHGAHCGLGDWYKEIEEGIQAALNQGPDYEWTTGWYSSKKEIASACITHAEGGICIEVSVSDDLDTPGLGTQIIQHTTDIERIREAIYEAWEEAEVDQKGNRLYVGYSVHDATENGGWVETYIRPSDALMWDYEQPPGDNYHQWGFQDESEIPESEIPDDVKEKLAEWASDNDFGEFTYGDFTIKAWDKKE